jgi:glycosyltransferase involved in cell wall biosynthesis
MALKILQTVPSIDLHNGGGLGVAALALHQRLLADGHNSRLITTRRNGDNCEPGVTAVRMVLSNPFFYDPRLRAIIESAVRNADIVHAHGLYNYFNWCVGRACARWNKPLVYHPHGTLAPWYLRKRWLAKKIVHKIFEDRNFALVRRWRAVSEQERGDIKRQCPGADIVVIPYGFDLANFPSRAERLPKSCFPDLDASRRCLLFLGRIAGVKGLDLLLDAWSRLRRFHDEWQLVVAGPDFEGYRRKLLARASLLEGRAAPLILNSVTGSDKLRLLNCADLFVLPSRAEGLPIAMLEALACHVPVVVTTACNISPDTLGDAGWICAPTAENISESLSKALSTGQQELRRKGEAGRCLIHAKHDWKLCSAAIIECSEHVVDLERRDSLERQMGRTASCDSVCLHVKNT